MASAIYAGSFDPITSGHLGIIRSGLIAFERLIVAVVANPGKAPLFSADERMAMIREALAGEPRVEVDRFEDGLLVDYARSRGVNVILKGLRALGDFEHELQMANMNRHLAPGIVTVFVMTDEHFFVSSSLVKEVASLGGDLAGVVPENVAARLREKFGRTA
ncbi:MAG: pantetheine-phosphate adenylyltransferase [Dehalococcoidia bacterium]